MGYAKCLIPLLFSPLYLAAQKNYVFEHLTVTDGMLSNPHVNIYQDTRGFYWFSSVEGIQRFDGKNFITYKYDYNNKSVPGDWVGKPFEDKEHNIWIMNEQGLNIFNVSQRVFIRIYMPDAVDSNQNNVTCILNDDSKNTWIVTGRNLFRYNYSTRKPELFCAIPVNKDEGIARAEYDSSRNCLWVLITGKKNRLARFDYTTKDLHYDLNKSLDELLGHPNPISLFKLDKSNCLWMVNYLGDMIKYNTSTGETTHYNILHENNREKIGIPNSTLNDCLDDGNGAIWFCGDFFVGLIKYDKKSNSFLKLPDENGAEYGLHYDEDIYSLFEDKEKNIWANTDLGMNIFNPRMQQFKYLDIQKNSAISKFSSNVTSFYETKNKDVWISTWGDGIFQYDSNFVLKKNYVHDKNDTTSLGEPFNRTWCFSEDDKGRLWVGCQYGMISILDPSTGKFTNKIIPGFDKRTIMYMTKDKMKNIWFGLFNGMLAKWDESGDTITVYKNLYGNGFLVIHGLYQDNGTNLWVTTSSYGLNKFDEQNNILADTNLVGKNLSSITSLNDSIIIGGTSGKGLFLYNKFTKQVKFINTSNGLSSDFIYRAITGKNNSAWVLADNGIEKINLANNEVSKYTASDGIRDNIFNNAFYKLSNGIILASANSGIIYFNPDSIKSKPPPPDVVITGCNIFEKNLSVDSLLQEKEIKLSYAQNTITIQYASLSFSGRKTNTYYYKLKGVDNNWISAGTGNAVTYANLSPGSYIFQVKAQNADGVETKNITSIYIVITPPWWQTWWAYILWTALVAAAVYVVYAYRKRNHIALANIRQKIANDLHDDIGSTLNSISVYSEVAAQQMQTNNANTKLLLERMGNASRNMIDTMNDIVWAVNPKNDQFENIILRMHYFAGELLSGKHILLEFNVDEKVSNIKLPMEKRKNFYLIFKEAITNAYKYSDAKKVSVNIAAQGNHLIMTITDDGKGFQQNKNSLGNGLKNMQTRAKENNAVISINSAINNGTIIELNMPVR